MEKAEQAGVQFIPGVRVDALIREGNKVTGVRAGDDTEANIVIPPMASTLCWGGPWGWFLPLLHITMPLA